ncbi:hypothetical protein AAG747_27210 [Rapidithrix thailandica]|uniref:Outer membrane protein beta-barrel domain-containing protein n=1 Tax=Rapidithrix thailandica TaxID=413964 RepID=A0AAW9SFF6_9BACT
MKKHLLFIVLLCVVSLSSKAQKGISLSLDHESPQGELGDIYNSTIGFTGSYVINKENTVFNITAGYHAFQAQQDSFYYQVNSDELRVASYGKYSAIPVYMGMAYKITLFDKLDLNLGGDVGMYYVIYSLHTIDAYHDTDESYAGHLGLFSPKAGLVYTLFDSFQIKLQSKYNLILDIGNSAPYASNHHSELGHLYRTWTNGLSLTYYFPRF